MIDAVVVTHNVRDQALRCVRALRWARPAPGRIVVVDTGDDGTGGTLAGLELGLLDVIARPDNPGYGMAANAGVDATDAPLVVICNADVYPAVDALGVLAECLEAMPDVACAGPALVDLDGSPQDSAFRFPGVAQAVLDLWPVPDRLRASRLNGRVRAGAAPVEIDHPLGAFVMVRRLAFDLVGGFSPDFWMYAEEIDLCRRFKALGWRIAHVPAARVWHAGGASTSQYDGEMLAELYRSRFRWYRRHAPPVTATAACAAMRAGLWLRARLPGPRRRAFARALEAVRAL